MFFLWIKINFLIENKSNNTFKLDYFFSWETGKQS